MLAPEPTATAEPPDEAAQNPEHTLVPRDLPDPAEHLARDTFGDTFIPVRGGPGNTDPTAVIDPASVSDPVPDIDPASVSDPASGIDPVPGIDPTPDIDPVPDIDPTPDADPAPVTDPTPVGDPVTNANPVAARVSDRVTDPVTEPILAQPTTPYPGDDAGLISASPWSLSSPGAAPVAPAPQPAGWSPIGQTLPFGHVAQDDPDQLGDHDEATIKRSALPPQAPGPRPVTALNTPTVLASLCPERHPNPPNGSQCRLCGAPIPPQDPVPVHRPSLGRLRASVGMDVELDRPSVIGRMPRRDGAVGDEMPRLVQVANSEQDLSRSHLEIRIEDWQVRVVDLDSRNGTFVALPGRNAERLRAFEPTLIVPGTVIMLSQDVTFTFEVAG